MLWKETDGHNQKTNATNMGILDLKSNGGVPIHKNKIILFFNSYAHLRYVA